MLDLKPKNYMNRNLYNQLIIDGQIIKIFLPITFIFAI